MTAINNLISLASIDEEIKEIESSRGDLPSRIKKLEMEKDQGEIKIEELNSELSNFEKKHVELQRNKDDFQISLDKYKDQLYLVKNNKEYDALNNEIDVVKKNLFDITEELSSISENKDNINEEIKLSNNCDFDNRMFANCANIINSARTKRVCRSNKRYDYRWSLSK